MFFAKVALDLPVAELFDYALPAVDSAEAHAAIGRRVEVPFGRRVLVGLVLEVSSESQIDASRVKPVRAVLEDIPPLTPQWIALLRFCSTYYQHPLGAAALSALPAGLRSAAKGGRSLSPLLWSRLVWQGPQPAWKKSERTKAALAARLAAGSGMAPGAGPEVEPGVGPVLGWELVSTSPKALDHVAEWMAAGQVVPAPAPPLQIAVADQLNDEQQKVLAAVEADLASGDSGSRRRSRFGAHLLFGITGSGKTEVYLNAVAKALALGRQVLMLVPEINLTPRLLQLVRGRFPASVVVGLHSELNESQRLHGWLLAHTGVADVVLGTRLAVLSSMPRLGLIVVDEEHDPSFKQQEGMRYSARDLAVFRASNEKLPVVLGSATPSLETYAHAESGRYTKQVLTKRAVRDAVLPTIRLIDLNTTPLEHGVSAPVWDALKLRLEAGQQSLVFLNRRGFAPVLSCPGCGWVSACTRCTSYLVMHRTGAARNLRPDGMFTSGHLICHHCGLDTHVPEACPVCGNVDIKAYGQGTQRLESRIAEVLPQARVLRVDRDAASRKGAAERLLAQAHGADVDILVGTQMLAKGHDFKRLTLVAALNVDSALFSADFRASERLFAQLMQVAGRAGRASEAGEVLVQTRNPGHPLFQALLDHNYERFARTLLKERRAAGLPPAGYQAMLRAEARTLDKALDFLRKAAAQGEGAADVMLYDPVPMVLTKLMNVERAQLMVESASRPALQAFLTQWNAWLHANAGGIRWHLEVDPLEI